MLCMFIYLVSDSPNLHESIYAGLGLSKDRFDWFKELDQL